ncbi:MAG: HEPN domain-containing protein [Promethearchaeota archaeon]
MSQVDFAKDYLREASFRIDTAKQALDKEAFAYCVLQSQEAVELSIKAALRLIGVDYPKWHDVGKALSSALERFPEWFQENITGLAKISRSLAMQREAAMYGSEVGSKAPGSLFDNDDAKKSLENATFTFNLVKKLISSLEGK